MPFYLGSRTTTLKEQPAGGPGELGGQHHAGLHDVQGVGGSPRVGGVDREHSVPGGLGVEGGQQLPHGGGQGAHVQEDGGVPKKWFGPIKSGFAQEFRKVIRYNKKVLDRLVQRGIEKCVRVNQKLYIVDY